MWILLIGMLVGGDPCPCKQDCKCSETVKCSCYGKCECKDCPGRKKADAKPDFRWTFGSDTDHVYLFDGPHCQLGCWVYSEQAWHKYNPKNDSWGFGSKMPKGYPTPPAQSTGKC